MRKLCTAFLALFLAGVADAQTVDVSIYMDLDSASGTCSAAGVTGIDAFVGTSVDRATNQVSRALVFRCQAGSLVPVATSDAALGLDRGLQSSDVVELSALLSDVFPGVERGQIEVTAVTGNGPSTDVAAGPGITRFGPPLPVPGLTLGGLVLLVVLLGGAAFLVLKRNRAVLIVSLLIVSAAVWAMNFLVDGEVGDWDGISPLADSVGDVSDDDADVVAVFSAAETGTLFFRVDIVDVEAE